MWLALIILFFGHWFADFVVQRHVWAMNKSKSNIALTKHVVSYTVVLGLFAIPVVGLLWAPAFTVFNGILHWCIDYVTSRITSKLYKQERYHDFFAVVGFDQWLHYTVMFISLAAIYSRL